MCSERRVLLSGGGVSGGADRLPVSSGTDNLILRTRDRPERFFVIDPSHLLFPVVVYCQKKHTDYI